MACAWAPRADAADDPQPPDNGLGSKIDLGVLDAEEGFELLCKHRQPEEDAEAAAAYRLVEALGCTHTGTTTSARPWPARRASRIAMRSCWARIPWRWMSPARRSPPSGA